MDVFVSYNCFGFNVGPYSINNEDIPIDDVDELEELTAADTEE